MRSSGVNGVCPIGKTPRSGFAAADTPVPASVSPAAPQPSISKKSRLPRVELALTSIESSLTIDAHEHLIKRVVIDGITQPRFRRRGDVAVFFHAEFVLVIRPVGELRWVRNFEPIGIGKREFDVLVNGEIQNVAPIVRGAFQAEGIRK